MIENGFVKEYDLYFDTDKESYFDCCGDEDLYPFKCKSCGHIMVYCYECDTLYRELNSIENIKERIYWSQNLEKQNVCKLCGASIENLFTDKNHFVKYEEWIEAGCEDLLRKYLTSKPAVPTDLKIDGKILTANFEWITRDSGRKGEWLLEIENIAKRHSQDIEISLWSKNLIDNFDIKFLIIKSSNFDFYFNEVFKYSLENKCRDRDSKRAKGLFWNPTLLDFIKI